MVPLWRRGSAEDVKGGRAWYRDSDLRPVPKREAIRDYFEHAQAVLTVSSSAAPVRHGDVIQEGSKCVIGLTHVRGLLEGVVLPEGK